MASVNTVLGIVLVWYIAVVILLWKVRQDSDAAACLASQRLITVLEYVPYMLRAADLVSVIPTMNAYYNVQAEFFETDWRTFNNFTLIATGGNVIEGETNWVGYRITLNDPTSFDFSCFSSFVTFNFVGPQ